ncbi:unnamed protein product [Caenorhabditis bovis]|uniref:Uncharacterized protein n=1 Tax=Caenorhabditis bovis TaxID=2654633 RepID=A0A8S1EAY2_9PELO|nr:unnamed protein product [Caenorhabditis bovis]
MKLFENRKNIFFERLLYSNPGSTNKVFNINEWRRDIENRIDGQKWIIMATSAAGHAALNAAQRKPSNVLGLFLFCPGTNLDLNFVNTIAPGALNMLLEKGQLIYPPSRNGHAALIDVKGLQEYVDTCITKTPGDIDINCPVTIVHGTEDTLVPYENSVKLLDRLNSSKKELVTIEGGTHYFDRFEISELVEECLNEAQLMEILINQNNYSKHKLPGNGVSVSVEFWIQEINSISEMTNDFELEMYINEMWNDPNLRFEKFPACKDNVTLDQNIWKKIWTPNTCFVNSKIAEIHESPFLNVFLTLFSNGTVWANYRVKIKGPCNMDLEDFPMDTQSCRLNYQSFSYNNEEVRLHWKTYRKPVFTLQEIQIADFFLREITPAVIRRSYPAGSWDELIVTFVFERRYMWYFLQAYLPTFFSIFISWLAFSLGPHAITPRTVIGVNALLSMIFHFGSIMKNLPRVSYIKAIDIWMLCSMTFVFLSLIELAIVGYKSQKNSPDNLKLIEKIDKIACFLFPAAFSVFNIIYWARYGFKIG